jgi:hypothetical protein
MDNHHFNYITKLFKQNKTIYNYQAIRHLMDLMNHTSMANSSTMPNQVMSYLLTSLDDLNGTGNPIPVPVLELIWNRNWQF